MVNFGEFLKTWSLRSNSVTRQVTFIRIKLVKNAIIEKLKCDILGDFQTFWIKNVLFAIVFNSCFGPIFLWSVESLESRVLRREMPLESYKRKRSFWQTAEAAAFTLHICSSDCGVNISKVTFLRNILGLILTTC